MLCHVMSRHVTSRHVTSCHVMSCMYTVCIVCVCVNYIHIITYLYPLVSEPTMVIWSPFSLRGLCTRSRVKRIRMSGRCWPPMVDFLGKSMGNPWEIYGKSMGNLWESHGKSMGKPWEIHGKSMGNPWEIYRKFIDTLR